MAGVNLDPTDDADSMAQYGGPVPEGQTDEIEAKAIKHDPAPRITSAKSKKDKGYVGFNFLPQFSPLIEDRPMSKSKTTQS